MSDLRSHFITVERPFKEGTVEVFEQRIPAAGVERAVLSITALGVYEAELNGKKIGDLLFTPGYTYYPKDLHYQIYDVTALLAEENLLRVYLGQGWYCGRFTCDNKVQIYGERPAVGGLGQGSGAYDTLRQILELHSGDQPQAEKDLHSALLLTKLLTQLLQCTVNTAQPAQTPAIMEKIRAYLTQTYQKNCTLSQLGARFGLSPCYLQRQFKQYYGQSPSEYLAFQRIVHAKELLRTTQKSISEVAYAVGFENPGYFSRLFKRSEALTPQEYRRLWPNSSGVH